MRVFQQDQRAAGNGEPRLCGRLGVRRCRVWRANARFWLAFAVFVLASHGVPAWSAKSHGFIAEMGDAPPGNGLVAPVAVAVDEKRGLMFVGDPGSGFVDVFAASGEYVTRFGGGTLFASGIGVDEASGDVYVADRFANAIAVFKPAGAGGYAFLSEWWGTGVAGGEFGQVMGVAVDNSSSVSGGDVYVVDRKSLASGGGVVDVFKPRPAGPGEGLEGELVRSLSSGSMELPNGVAVSRATGRVLVADSPKGAVYLFGPEGGSEGKLVGKGSPNGSFKTNGELGNVAGVGVDEGSGDVYVAEAERHAVSQYAYDDTKEEWVWVGWITTTPAGDLGEPRGVALDSSGDVYVADAGSARVDRFGVGVVVPGVVTERAAKSGLTRTSAVLSGTVDGEGKPASYYFQYGETWALGLSTPVQSAGTGLQSVSVRAEGLLAGHSYYYRIVGENEDGANYGVIRGLEARPAVDALETGPVTNLEPEGVTVTGSLKRESLETSYYFQYGASSAYGKQAPEPAGEVPAALEEKEEKQLKTVQAQLAGLVPNTTYHYRVVAKNVYGSTYGEDRVFTTSGPPRVTIEPVSGITQHEATLHAQINPDQLQTVYRVQYGQTTGYGQETSTESAGSGSTPGPVSVTLPGLNVGTSYHYRIIAENTAGTTITEDQAFTTLTSAPLDATYTSGITSTEATLHALINPFGNDTHYYFQYGPQPCYSEPAACTDSPAAPGEDIGDGSTDVPGETSLSGLQPGTVYHYRVIAANTLGTTEGAEHTFTTQTLREAFTLPDGRAWEMVTPADKGGAPVEALTREGGIILAAEDGERLAYVVNGALGENVEGNRSPEMQQVLATRTPNGWTSQDIANPNSKAKGITTGEAPEYQFFSSDLSSALVEPVGAGAEPPLAEGVTQATIYLRDNATGTYLPVVTEANVASGVSFGGKIHFVAASANLSYVVFASKVGLTGGRSTAGLYEWSDGRLVFVSVLPGGRPAHTPELGYLHEPAGAVSVNGSRVVWTVPGGAAEASRGHLYLRDTVRGETVQLDAARGVPEPEEGSAQYQGASSDGSRVFFTDKQRLTLDSTAEPSQGEGKPDLYACELTETEGGNAACRLTDLTVDREPGGHAFVQGLIFGSSQDGASVYLVAQGVLAGNANGNGETATSGADNLYGLRLGEKGWATTFIARLAGQDKPEWEGARLADTAYVTARVSPDGRYLAFMSSAPVTGYDNVDANPAANGARDEEVFLYDAINASLRCVSCSPNGARPNGVFDAVESGEGAGLLVDRREVWVGHWLAGNIPGWTAQSLPTPEQPGALFQSRYLSNGARLYFNSPDQLVPAAGNGKEDVYEYEPSGMGTCQSPTGGCVSLISGGESSHESAFLEATPDGGSVFFLTEAQLLAGQDTDTAFDIYDARECTQASPCVGESEAAPPECDETSTCRPAQPPQQVPGIAPASVTAAGPGNVTAQAKTAGKREVKAKTVVKKLTRTQRLKRAIGICRKRYAHSKKRRKACERGARRRYVANRHKGRAKHRHTARPRAVRSDRAGNGAVSSRGGGRR
jgi:NHL repeat